MADEENMVSKMPTTSAKSTSMRKKTATDKRMGCLEKKVDKKSISLMEMMKILAQCRTGTASASTVQDNNPFGGSVELCQQRTIFLQGIVDLT